MNYPDMVFPMQLWGGPLDGEGRYVTVGHGFAAVWEGESHLYLPWKPGYLKWVAPQ